MQDLISRQQAIDALSHMMDTDGFRDGWAVSRANVDCMLRSLPSVQSEPHKAEGKVELIIKIPEETYRSILKNGFIYDEDNEEVADVIRNATLLPKDHGRLIDADALPLNAIDDANYGSNYIRIAQTIIEADKESEI